MTSKAYFRKWHEKFIIKETRNWWVRWKCSSILHSKEKVGFSYLQALEFLKKRRVFTKMKDLYTRSLHLTSCADNNLKLKMLQCWILKLERDVSSEIIGFQTYNLRLIRKYFHLFVERNNHMKSSIAYSIILNKLNVQKNIFHFWGNKIVQIRSDLACLDSINNQKIAFNTFRLMRRSYEFIKSKQSTYPNRYNFFLQKSSWDLWVKKLFELEKNKWTLKRYWKLIKFHFILRTCTRKHEASIFKKWKNEVNKKVIDILYAD